MAKAKNSLIEGGFKLAEAEKRESLVLALSGHHKNGKTHFGLTGPEAIAFFNLDHGIKRALNKFVPGKEIYTYDISLPKPEVATEFGEKADGTKVAKIVQVVNEDVVEQAKKEWDKVVRLSRLAIANKSIRTMVYDTEPALWELMRLARFGKTANILPTQYGPVNLEYSGFIQELQDSYKNIIFLRKMRSVYINDKKTAKFEPAGFGGMQYLADVITEISYDDDEDEFSLTIIDCGLDLSLNGEVLEGPLCNFSALASMVVPDTKPSGWE